MRVIRRACITGPQRVEVESACVREPAEGEALVRTAFAGICGSDLHTYSRGHPWRDYPLCPGHEVSGTVEAVGKGTAEVGPGDPIYVFPELPCGACRYCTSGRANLCEQPGGVGGSIPGGMSEAFLVPASCARPLPAGVSLEAGSMVEPTATAVRSVHRAGSVEDKSIVILGAGTIGLLVLLVCRELGARSITVTDLVEGKRELAERLGAHLALDAARPGLVQKVREYHNGPADIVFDCVAAKSTLDAALALASKGGTVVVVGAPTGTWELPIVALHHGEVTLTGSEAYLEKDFAEALELISEGLPVAELITRRFSIHRAQKAFLAAKEGLEIKVQLVRDDEATCIDRGKEITEDEE